jgi:hypothetical protein
MDPIMELARKHKLLVVEDTAEAFGGTYKGRMAGTIGHAGAISFCQNKTFTTGGEGGMVVTDDEELAWACRSFRDHGYDVAERLRLLELEQKLPYIHNRVGWNYRMTEMQSAIGLCELDRIDTWNMPRRRRNAQVLMDALRDVPQVLHLPIDTPKRRNGWYVFPITLDIDRMNCDIKQFVAALGAEGAPCWRVFWPQCHTEKAFQEHCGFGRANFPFRSREYTTPASADYSTMGGNAAECAGGLRGLKYGVTRDYVLSLEVVLASGEVIHTGAKTYKSVTGYDVTKLLIGSEGTLGVFTEITVKLIPLPEATLLMALKAPRPSLSIMPSFTRACM